MDCLHDGVSALFFGLQKILLRFEQVARLEHHRLRLVEDREVEHPGAGAARRDVVDAPQLALDRLDDRVEELVAHFEHQIEVREILRRQHVVDLVENRLHLVVHAHQVDDLLLRCVRMPGA